jgi:hypothetical protein
MCIHIFSFKFRRKYAKKNQQSLPKLSIDHSLVLRTTLPSREVREQSVPLTFSLNLNTDEYGLSRQMVMKQNSSKG